MVIDRWRRLLLQALQMPGTSELQMQKKAVLSIPMPSVTGSTFVVRKSDNNGKREI